MLHSAAERAQHFLGRKYAWGSVAIPKDREKAIYWLQLAADQGHSEAMYQLSNLYTREA